MFTQYENIEEFCIDCGIKFTKIDPCVVQLRCCPCQAKFRIRESNGEYPEAKKIWLNKLTILTARLPSNQKKSIDINESKDNKKDCLVKQNKQKGNNNGKESHLHFK